MADITPQQKGAFAAGLFFLLLFLSPVLLAGPALLLGPVVGDQGVGSYLAWAVIDGDASLGVIMRLAPAFLSASIIALVWPQRNGLFGGLVLGLLLLGVLAIVVVAWRLNDPERANNIWGPLVSSKVQTAEAFNAALQGYLSGTLLTALTLLGIVCGIETKTFLEKKQQT